MKNNNGRDNELDQLLKPLKSAAPTDLQMKKWKSALQKNNRKSSNIYSTSRTTWALQLVAASVIGIVIGAVAFKSNTSVEQPFVVAKLSVEDATFERSHDNLD